MQSRFCEACIALAMAMAAPAASGISSCPPEAGERCRDEFPSQFFAAMDVFAVYCAQSDPDNAKAYEAVLQRLLDQQTPEELVRVRSSPYYAAGEKSAKGIIATTDKDELAARCREFLEERK